MYFIILLIVPVKPPQVSTASNLFGGRHSVLTIHVCTHLFVADHRCLPKDRAWGGGWGPGGPPPYWTGERPGPIRGHGLKTGPGASAAGGGRRCHGGRRGGGP